jgi:hypothetical protein
MIKFRKNPFSQHEEDVKYQENESASKLLIRVLEDNGYSRDLKESFHVLINGLEVPVDLLEFTTIKESDIVLVAPRIKRGEGGQLFKQIAIIALTVTAAYFFPPALAFTNALFVAGVTIASTLALNALIPPPGVPGLGGLGSLGSFESSQMYTITSQQNAAKKFGGVPKVYGTHRIFPIIAANPYTEIEADTVSGNLTQYYYCIYDFGLGPALVGELKIGETLINEFTDVSYRLVDLNKPEISEGVWDDQVSDEFIYYKGDVEKESIGISLEGNQFNADPVEEYRLIRNTSDNVQGSQEEVSIDFQFPQGLTSFGTDGSTGQVEVAVNVEFSKVDEDEWKGFSNLDFVTDFSASGGVESGSFETFLTIPTLQPSNYFFISSRQIKVPASYDSFTNINRQSYTYTQTDYGYLAGQTQIRALQNGAFVGDLLVLRGAILGRVLEIVPDTGGFVFYVLEEPLETNVTVFSWNTGHQRGRNGVVFTGNNEASATATNNKLIRRQVNAGTVIFRNNINSTIYATVKFKPKELGQFKVRITRVQTTPSRTFRVNSQLVVLSIQSRFDREPIITDKRHLFLEIKIRATNQLNGSIQNLSGVVTSVLDVYDPDTQTWSKQPTSNPAWVFADLLTGEINKRAVSKDRLHLPSLLEWADFSDEIPTPPPGQFYDAERFQINFVLDFSTTLQSIINNITNAAQASLNIIDGKYGVLIDKLATTPVQIFTPRNSSNFRSQRNYSRPPDAVKVQYVEPDNSWQVGEAIIYNTGFDRNNAVIIDDLSTFACTRYEQAFRFGKYMMAQSKLRQERISLTVDFEHLVCTRGDLVYITQDVMKVGGSPARVKKVTGNRVQIDDAIETTPVPYGYTFRGVSGIQTSTLTVVDSDEFDVDGPIPAVGDIIIIGPVGSIVFECVVKSITPASDLSATLELVEKAPAIYEAESLDVIPDYEASLNPELTSDDLAPGPVEDLEILQNTFRVVGSSYQYYVDVGWTAPTGSAFENFEIYVDSGFGYNLAGFTKNLNFEVVIDPTRLGIEHAFKVLAVSANGNKIPLVEAPFVVATPERKITPPSDVTELFIDITNQVISFSWPAVSDPDLREYLIRYSTEVEGATWEASIPLLRADRNTTLASAQGRTGTYFIKAVDFNLNESSNAAQAVTAIPRLFDLNVIEETNDFPMVQGELVAAETDGTSVTLSKKTVGGVETNEYFEEGFYYYQNFLDLGEIYTVRLQSKIRAEGFTVSDLMSNWNPLSAVLALSNAGTAAWDVETQYRVTDSFNIMSDWPSLDVIDPISEGVQDLWSDWRKFTIGDATGRIFQFRLKLISNVPNVTPRVFNGVIRSDMPDRVETFNNIISDVGGTTLLYDPPFKGPGTSPNIQITQDNAQTGDTYTITGKTLDGFTITFYNELGNPVSRQFDAFVKGYGRKFSQAI